MLILVGNSSSSNSAVSHLVLNRARTVVHVSLSTEFADVVDDLVLHRNTASFYSSKVVFDVVQHVESKNKIKLRFCPKITFSPQKY